MNITVLFVLYVLLIIIDLFNIIVSVILMRERKEVKNLKKELALFEARKHKLENIENELCSKVEQV